MKWIVITSPGDFPGEVSHIMHLLDVGVDIIHLRKPEWDIKKYEELIKNIPCQYHGRIVIHDYFELFSYYGLRGIHLNRRNHIIPVDFAGSLSCSCHSLEEVERYKTEMDYLFLSPIFNSISKCGYNSGFSTEQLIEAHKIIDNKVIALGGVTLKNISILRQLHFGGIAMLGDIWQRINDNNYENYLNNVKEIAIV